MLKFLLIAFVCLLVSRTDVVAQTYEKEYVTLFAYQVKQIDEFIERFNDDDSTLIKLYYKKYNPSKELTREQLIKSLFNAERKNWDFKQIHNFIDTVDNSINPLKLHLLGDNWYVRLNCPITWKNIPKTVTLTLKLQFVRDDIYKWIITGVNAPFLRPVSGARNNDNFRLPDPQDSTTALNSVSNAIDFMNIDQVSTDIVNISNYFMHANHYKDDLPVFVNECLKGHISISSPNSTAYYFSQIPGWLLEIKRFNRRTKNSGWLISALVKTNISKKSNSPDD